MEEIEFLVRKRSNSWRVVKVRGKFTQKIGKIAFIFSRILLMKIRDCVDTLYIIQEFTFNSCFKFTFSFLLFNSTLYRFFFFKILSSNDHLTLFTWFCHCVYILFPYISPNIAYLKLCHIECVKYT